MTVYKIQDERLQEPELRQFYADLAAQRAAEIKGGKKLDIRDVCHNELEMLVLHGALSADVLQKGWNSCVDYVQGGTFRDVRRRILNDLLGEEIASLDVPTRAKLEEVRDPVLDVALPAKNVSDVDPGLYNHYHDLMAYMRTLTFLEVLKASPEVVKKLSSDSSHFPHRLFESKTPTMAELEREIAEEFLTMFPEELHERIAAIDLSFKRVNGLSTFHKSLGKFRIPQNVAYCFTEAASEAELNLFSEIKSVVYSTLLDYTSLAQNTLHDAGKTGKALSHYKSQGGKLGFSPAEYATILTQVANYARNQILGHWSKGNNFQPPLARRLGMKIQVEDERLTITYRGNMETYRKDSSLLNTTAYFPLCVLLLNRAYQGVRELAEGGERITSTTVESNPQPNAV
ncbi:hypothetical protein HYX14_04390 [Candidatus Woesearchaeota archaeon]|nr:hypothetical protein [Candidatus Woesearchaeota archaeon]